MRLNLKSTNFDLTESVKSQVDEKLSGIDKYFGNIQQIDVEVGLTRKGQQKGKIYFCEVNVSVPRKLLRYRIESEDMARAINDAKKGIQLEIKKYKEMNRGS
ncbi:ribosome-associated translation inhibitor RaiA [Candidatus Falkowbacteria bacterium]|nr:ribosome-associated translation inhibitor RaiA [Candidatus Falkowbacteria bacterium]